MDLRVDDVVETEDGTTSNETLAATLFASKETLSDDELGFSASLAAGHADGVSAEAVDRIADDSLTDGLSALSVSMVRHPYVHILTGCDVRMYDVC